MAARSLFSVLLVVNILVALPARAECACETDANGDCTGVVTCAPETFNALAHDLQDAGRDMALCLAGNKRLEAELAARLVRVEALEKALQDSAPVSPWLVVAAGAGGVALGLVVALVAAK